MMADEAGEVRKILREGWRGPGELCWVEAARGGTVGAPDVFVPLGLRRGYLPLELKWWEMLNGNVEYRVRPAQRRFHRLAAEARQRTAFLARLSTGELVLLPGERLPPTSGDADDLAKKFKEAWSWTTVLADIVYLRAMLLDEKFWRGKNG